jgi:hypothetical protein
VRNPLNNGRVSPMGVFASAVRRERRFGRRQLTEAPEGGWGLRGHASTNAGLVAAARAEIATLSRH